MGKIRLSKTVHPKIADAQARLSAATLRGASQNALTIYRDELRNAELRFGQQAVRA